MANIILQSLERDALGLTGNAVTFVTNLKLSEGTVMTFEQQEKLVGNMIEAHGLKDFIAMLARAVAKLEGDGRV